MFDHTVGAHRGCAGANRLGCLPSQENPALVKAGLRPAVLKSPSTKNYMHFALMAAMVASNPSYGRLGPAAEAMWEFPSHSQEPAGIFAVCLSPRPAR